MILTWRLGTTKQDAATIELRDVHWKYTAAFPGTFVMPTVRLTNGIEIDCKSAEEARQVVNQFTAEIVPGGVTRNMKKRRDRLGGSPGKGPIKLWRMAEWYAAKIGGIKNVVRSQLTKMKNDNPRKFLDLEEEFQGFTKWFATRMKLKEEQIGETLAALFEEEPAKYSSAVLEFHDQYLELSSI